MIRQTPYRLVRRISNPSGAEGRIGDASYRRLASSDVFRASGSAARRIESTEDGPDRSSPHARALRMDFHEIAALGLLSVVVLFFGTVGVAAAVNALRRRFDQFR